MKDFRKITDNNFDCFDEEGYKEWLSDIVSYFLEIESRENNLCLELSLIDCESPIEQLLAIELENIKLINIIKYNPFVDVIDIKKQEEIIIKNKKYRVDFFIPVIYKNQENIGFIVECDGYEYHQKTKKQVENDNKRQRELQEAGYEIIRFSGTEIYHNPYKCASEIKNIILSKCKYIKDE